MSTSTRHAISLSTAMLCLTSTLAFGCHNDVIAESTSSATEDGDYFGTNTTSGGEPTTTAGDPIDGGSDPTDGGYDPSDFCRLHPADDYVGSVFVCSGKVRGGIDFDYFGDPDLPVHEYLPCFDMTAPPFNLEKPAGYVYSCFIQSGDYAFGPDVAPPNGHQIDACCVQDSPVEAAIEYCRVDGAEELCYQASDSLNAFRAEIPHLPATSELHHQLENLNEFLATAGTQTSCAKSIATSLLEVGDFTGDIAKAAWQVEDEQALDPEVGWPWFREIRMNVHDFQIDDAENNGLACNELEDDALTGGLVKEGRLTVDSELGTATAATSAGRYSFRRSDCRLASCPVSLETFELRIKDFKAGSLALSDISVSLAAPAVGLMQDGALTLAEERMHVTARFRLTSDGRPMFDGAPVSVHLRNHGVAQFQLGPDQSLAVERLDVLRWPFEFALVSDVSR